MARMKLAVVGQSRRLDVGVESGGRLGVAAGGDRLEIKSSGAAIPPVILPTILSWAWDASASLTDCTVNVSAVSSLPCVIFWRMKDTDGKKSFVMFNGIVDETEPHLDTITLDLTYAGRTYDSVEYSLSQGGIEVVGWTLFPGAYVNIPLPGADPTEGGGTGPNGGG